MSFSAPARRSGGGDDDDEKLSRAIKQNLIGRDTTEGVKSHAVRQYIELSWDRTDDGDLIRPETDSRVAEKLGVSRQLVSKVVSNANGGIIYSERIDVREIREENPELSFSEVAEKVDASRPTVTKWIKEDFDEGNDEGEQATQAAADGGDAPEQSTRAIVELLVDADEPLSMSTIVQRVEIADVEKAKRAFEKAKSDGKITEAGDDSYVAD